MILQGFPAANTPAGMSLVTTLPDPITAPFPMVTPPHTVTLEAIQQPSSMVMGLAYSKSYAVPSSLNLNFRSSFKSGCNGVTKLQFGPKNTSSPMVTGQQSKTTKLKLT